MEKGVISSSTNARHPILAIGAKSRPCPAVHRKVLPVLSAVPMFLKLLMAVSRLILSSLCASSAPSVLFTRWLLHETADCQAS